MFECLKLIISMYCAAYLITLFSVLRVFPVCATKEGCYECDECVCSTGVCSKSDSATRECVLCAAAASVESIGQEPP